MDFLKKLSYFFLLSIFLLGACTAPAQAPTQAPESTLPTTLVLEPTRTLEPTAAPTSPPAMQSTEISAHKLTAIELDAFEAYFQEAMKKAGIPGAAVALVQEGEVIYLKGFGVRQLGKSDPVTPQTLFMLASTSKPLTSLMMATLVDDGKVTWDTLAKDILPGFMVGSDELTSKLTFHHMVCACTGWQGDRSDIFFRASVPAEEIVSSMAEISPVGDFERTYKYSNQMVAAAGYLAGYAAGGSKEDLWKGYADAMQSRVFDPLGMTRTTLSTEAVQLSGNYSLPHGKTLEYTFQPMPVSVEHPVVSVAPAGGIWSSAEDMTKILLLELGMGVGPDGKRVVSQENMIYTWQPQIAIGVGEVQYALAWFTEPYLGKALIHHSGNSAGFSTDLSILPEANLGIVILTNAEGVGSFTDAVRYRFLEQAFRQEPEHNAVFEQRLAMARKNVSEWVKTFLPEYDKQGVEPYLGEFQNDLLGKIKLQDEDGTLKLYAEGFTSTLSQKNAPGKLLFFEVNPPWATLPLWWYEFEKDSAGNPVIAMYENGGLEPTIFTKVPEP